jgi:AcrR family transcriptional regulator
MTLEWCDMAGRRSALEARDTRASIVRRAADVGSVEGLEGITIGRLAGDLGLSKAGVIGHFGTKEELQLATLELGAELFRERVWVPARDHEPGMPRLIAICEAWCGYLENAPLPGGCLIATASVEFDSRSGRVHDAVAKFAQQWRDALVHDIRIAVERGDLPADSDVDQIAFTLEALAAGMQPARMLQGDMSVAERCLRAMLATLGQ